MFFLITHLVHDSSQCFFHWYPVLTNSVTSGGVTLFVAGTFVLGEARAAFFCPEHPSYSTSTSLSFIPGLVTISLVAPAWLPELAKVGKSQEFFVPIEAMLIALTEPNWSEEPLSELQASRLHESNCWKSIVICNHPLLRYYLTNSWVSILSPVPAPMERVRRDRLTRSPFYSRMVGGWTINCWFFNQNIIQFKYFFSIKIPGRSRRALFLICWSGFTG